MVEQTAQKEVKKWMILTVLALSVSIIVIDGTIVNVSLPVIIKDLKLNFTNAEWIITIYSLIFSALLITTGRIADVYGRKKMLITGIILFIIGSIMASLANGIGTMLIARFIQGVGGAVVLPTTLSTVNTFFKGHERIIAFAVWGSVISGMAAIGPLLGGFFTTYMSWRWVFWINIPIGLLIIVGALKYIPENYGEKWTGMFDIIGFILSFIAFGALVYGLIEGRNYGWWHAKEASQTVLGLSRIPWLLAIGTIALIALIFWELHLIKKERSHLISLNLFQFKSFAVGNLIACIVAIGEFGLLFLLPLFLQNVLFLTAMQSGLLLCLLGIGAFFAGGFATPFVKKTSPAVVVSTGLLLEAIALFGFYLTIKPASSVVWVALWLVIYGVGLGFASAQLTSIVMQDVPDQKAGQGSSIQSTVRQLGSALGVAIIGTIFVSFLWHDVPGSLNHIQGMPPQIARHMEVSVIDSAGSSIYAIKENPKYSQMMPAPVKKELIHELDVNFTKSIVKSIGVSSLILFISFFLTFLLPRKKKSPSTK